MASDPRPSLPGRSLEAASDRRPREMVVAPAREYRIRLTRQLTSAFPYRSHALLAIGPILPSSHLLSGHLPRAGSCNQARGWGLASTPPIGSSSIRRPDAFAGPLHLAAQTDRIGLIRGADLPLGVNGGGCGKAWLRPNRSDGGSLSLSGDSGPSETVRTERDSARDLPRELASGEPYRNASQPNSHARSCARRVGGRSARRKAEHDDRQSLGPPKRRARC